MHESVIEEVLSRRGCRPRRTQEGFSSQCPAHKDHSASFAINAHSGAYICFSAACGVRGNLYSFLRDYGGWGSRQLADLKKYAPLKTDPILPKPVPYSERRLEPRGPAADEHLLRVYKTLCPKYMLDRGFSQKTLKHFEVGYDEQQRQVVIPLRHADGRLAGFLRRHIDAWKKPKYLVDMPEGARNQLPLFNAHRLLQTAKDVIVVEGSLDCMWMTQNGFPNTVALLGTHLKREHQTLLTNRFDKITLMLDNDDAGRSATRSILGQVRRAGRLYVAAPFPTGKDAQDNTADLLRRCVESRVLGLMWSRNATG